MIDNCVQLQNKPVPKCTVDDGADERIVILCRDVQFLKFLFPMKVIDSGKSIDGKLVHPANARSSIATTDGGIGTLINAVLS